MVSYLSDVSVSRETSS